MPFYCVVRGYRPGIYQTWVECRQQVDGFSNSQHRKFQTLAEAQQWQLSNTTQATDQPVKINSDLISQPSQTVETSCLSSSLTELITLNQPITIFTDGSCQIKPDGTRQAGFAYYIPQTRRKVSVKLVGPPTPTNNRAELLAIITAVKQFPPRSQLEIVTDSRYAILAFTSCQIGQKITQLKPVPNFDLITQAIQLASEYQLQFRYVQAHTDNLDYYSQGNQVVDQLAKRAAMLSDS